MAIVNGPSAGGSGGGLITLSSQLLANRQTTEAQRVQDQQEREAIRTQEALDQDRRRRDAAFQQQTLGSGTNTDARGFAGAQNGFAAGQGGRSASAPQSAPGGGFAAFGQAPFGTGGSQSNRFESASFGGFETRVRPRPSSTFLAQAIGQELRPGGDPPRAAGVASLYRQTQSAVDDALQRRNGLLSGDRSEDRGPLTA